MFLVQGFKVQGSRVQGSRVQGSPGSVRRKLSFKEQREYEALPARIAALEAEQKSLEARSAAPDFYKEGTEAIRGVMERLDTIGNELHVAYERWLEIESVVSQ